MSSPQQTAMLGARIAPLLRAGDTILLDGGIGAGKTHFARALIQARLGAAGQNQDVPSPTYTLVQTYDDGTTEICHADLYRLQGLRDVGELGLEDAFQNAICLVEWPDRLAGAAPDAALVIAFEVRREPQHRALRFTASARRWRELVPVLQAASDPVRPDDV
ncbi:MAG: tRNA (adenosine(37)-N6)-threonylcarbamoyltransferase complex ATPase subunit type 1 TsaE [Paracoccaceae bacterium]